MFSASEGWACTDGRTIFKFDGSKWNVDEYLSIEGGHVEFAGMHFSSRTDGWIVGGKHLGDPPAPGIVMHYDGAAWTEVAAPGLLELNAVFALARDDVWAGGLNAVYHYDGLSWTTYPADGWVWVLYFSAPDDGWAGVGDGWFLHWDGSSWAAVPSSTFGSVESIWFPTPDEGWAVGGMCPQPEIPSDECVFHYTAASGEWKPYPNPGSPDHKLLHGVHFAAPDDGWAVGQVIMRYDGREWRAVPCDEVGTCVFTLGGDQVWVGTFDGHILKYDP